MPTSSRHTPHELRDIEGLFDTPPAQVIGELPAAVRPTAQAEATAAIAGKVGLVQSRTIKLASPVFCAFKGMTREKSKHHHEAALLLTLGRDVPLDLCPSYGQAEARAGAD